MCEPLREKIHESQEGYPIGNPFIYFEPDDIKSAVEGLIKYHESIIEDFIQNLENKNWSERDKQIIVNTIEIEYDHLMNIEKWFEDVIE